MGTKKVDKEKGDNTIVLVGIAAIILFGLSQIVSAGQIIKYSCSGDPDYICVQDTNGIYNTIQECQNACILQQVTVDIIVNE